MLIVNDAEAGDGTVDCPIFANSPTLASEQELDAEAEAETTSFHQQPEN